MSTKLIQKTPIIHVHFVSFQNLVRRVTVYLDSHRFLGSMILLSAGILKVFTVRSRAAIPGQ